MDTVQLSRRLKTPAAARYIGLAQSTLEKDRLSGHLAVPYLKLGRAILYDTTELDAWLAAHRCRNTSEAACARKHVSAGATEDDARSNKGVRTDPIENATENKARTRRPGR
jgi:hypothetical protein